MKLINILKSLLNESNTFKNVHDVIIGAADYAESEGYVCNDDDMDVAYGRLPYTIQPGGEYDVKIPIHDKNGKLIKKKLLVTVNGVTKGKLSAKFEIK